MKHLIQTSYIADLKSIANGEKQVNIWADSGNWIFINGTPRRCQMHFEVLCGLRKPDVGEVMLAGVNPYTLSPTDGAAFRRDTIGAVPYGGGLIPELRLIDQIAFPMALAGHSNVDILNRIRSLTSELLPLHSLYNTPMHCTIRKQFHAAIVRAVIMEPKILVLNSFLDDLSDLDTDVLWQVLEALCPENAAVVYFSGGPAPQKIRWTTEMRI